MARYKSNAAGVAAWRAREQELQDNAQQAFETYRPNGPSSEAAHVATAAALEEHYTRRPWCLIGRR